MKRHHGDNERRRHASQNPYQQNNRAKAAPSATKWLLPILSRHLGIRTRRQQEIFLVGCIAIILALWFLTPVSDFCAALILYTVPIESDVALGREALISLETKYPRVHDRWGVRRIGSDLVNSGTFYRQDPFYRQLQQNPKLFDNIEIYKWDFGVVKAPPGMVNAFALPGGIVRVTDSLLNTLHLTDAELAALLGHEMGHILYRHSQKRAIKNHLLSTIWEAFSYEDSDGYNESFGEAVAEGLWKSASFLGELAFSRSDEYQADEAAWDLLASTYSTAVRKNINVRQFHPKSIKSLLSKLWKYQGGSGSTSWESTHPGTKDRIDALQKKWNELDTVQRRRFV